LEVLHHLRQKRRPIVRPARALVAATLVACGGGDRDAATVDTAVVQSKTPYIDSAALRGDTALASDSAGADSLAGPPGPTLVLLADSAAGAGLFRVKGKCLACHGAAGMGLSGLGPNLRDEEWLHGDGSFEFILRTITNGIARPAVAPIVMPAAGETLTPEETYRVAAYVYTLSHPGAAVADTATRIDTAAVIDTSRMPPPPAH
jgi:mono/diheme cytochrome c family protein